MSDRIFNAIILLDEPGGRHFCTWVHNQKKRIETRMKNMIPEGDLIICCSKKEMKNDYKAQAERVCERFGFKTVFEYGLTAKHMPIGDGFWNEMKSIYE